MTKTNVLDIRHICEIEVAVRGNLVRLKELTDESGVVRHPDLLPSLTSHSEYLSINFRLFALAFQTSLTLCSERWIVGLVSFSGGARLPKCKSEIVHS